MYTKPFLAMGAMIIAKARPIRFYVARAELLQYKDRSVGLNIKTMSRDLGVTMATTISHTKMHKKL